MSFAQFRADAKRARSRRRMYARINALPDSTVREELWLSPSGTTSASADATAYGSRSTRPSEIPPGAVFMAEHGGTPARKPRFLRRS